MAIQNNYNNYIKRQKQNSTGNFRDKIKNSLGGVAVGNATAKKTPSMMGQTGQVKTVGTLGVNNAPKPVTTPTTPQPTVQDPVSQRKPYEMSERIFTPQTTPNVLESTTQAHNTTSAPTTPQAITTTPNTAPVGMVSQSEISRALNVEPTEPMTVSDVVQINEIASNPQVQSRAYSSGKTPQQLAQELLEQQKEQMRKDWELKQQELEMQKNQAQQSYDQSLKDADKTYQETNDTLNEARYKQQKELAISGESRGIQYSPQQLGLEQVANINHNKNLAEASNKRNELLNNLSIQLGQAMANINLGLQNATNEYNKALGTLTSDYQKQMMDWEWDEQKTAEERKWQEEQAQKDRDFQKMMQELSQQWQAEQNALDRAQGKSGGGYGGYSYGGRGRSYSAWGRGRSRSSYDNWTNYGGYSNDLDLSTNEGLEAYVGTGKEYLTDYYNAVKSGGFYDLNDRGRAYKSAYDELMNTTKGLKNNEKAIEQFNDAYDVGLKHLYNRAKATSTNTPLKVGDTLIKPLTPLREEAIIRNKARSKYNEADFYSKYARTPEQRKTADLHKSIQGGYLKTADKMNALVKKHGLDPKSSTSTKKTNTKVSKSVSNLKNASSNVKKAQESRKTLNKTTTKQKTTKSASNLKNTKENIKKAQASRKNIKKTTTKNTTTKQKVSKSLSNIKKNIAKLFKRK